MSRAGRKKGHSLGTLDRGIRLFAVLLVAIPLAVSIEFPAVGATLPTLITPGVGIGPVRLGMSVGQVTALLGHPALPAQGGGLSFPQWAMTVSVQEGVVVRVSTASRLFQTTRGAGVGASHNQATQLIGDPNQVVTSTGGFLTALYPFSGIGFVFRGDRAVEVFVVPSVRDASIARLYAGSQPSSQQTQATNASTGGGSATSTGSGTTMSTGSGAASSSGGAGTGGSGGAAGGGVSGGGGAGGGGAGYAGTGTAGTSGGSPSMAAPVASTGASTPTAADPPAWSGIIDASRAIDWFNAGIGATIVNRTTQCGSTIAAYSGTAGAINSAIANCNNGYVLLGPGTFSLSSGIAFYSGSTAHSNVTLRGSGPTKTILNFTGGDGCGGQGANICVYGGSNAPYCCYSQFQYAGGTQAANWTVGYAPGTTQIQLASNGATNFGTLTVGMTIILDQQDDASDTNGVYVCQAIPCATESGGGQGRPGRSQIEMKRVVAINGTTITISPGLYNTNWRAAQTPGAWWGPMITGVGLENFTVNHGGSGTTVLAGTWIQDCYGCWIKNVRSLNPNRNHVWCYLSSNVTLRDSYLYGTLNSASQSYGFEGFGCNNPLIENNIFQHISLPVEFDTTIGGVVGYNYTYDDYYTAAGWQQAGLYEHASGTSFTLWEGNESPGYNDDDIHGSHNQETLFRNWLSGLDACSYSSPCTNQTVPVILQTLTRGINIIGNVLGCFYDPGKADNCTGYTGVAGQSYYTNYEDRYDLKTTTTPDHTIYVLGYCQNVSSINPNSGCSTSGGTQPNDALTPTTLFRWGNYDTATGTVRWQASEVPTGAVPYMNGTPVPTIHTLPASFYMVAKPVWWGSMPWPAIGPDVTGGTGPGGHAYPIPAAVCYNKTAKDSTGVLLFDANACYQQGPPALPPIQLRWDSGPNQPRTAGSRGCSSVEAEPRCGFGLAS